jgi:hypothetical protein
MGADFKPARTTSIADRTIHLVFHRESCAVFGDQIVEQNLISPGCVIGD